MFRLLQHRVGHHLILTAVCAALFLPNLGGPSLWDIDEGNNLECAREMLESGNWVVPTFNYVLRVDKPALLYWLQIGCYRLFGVSEFAGRLPSALSALLAVLLTYEWGRRLFAPGTGLLAGLVLASSTLFCAAAHFANPDALLNACTLLTLFFFWQGYVRGPRIWWLLAGAGTGLGVLAKGPVGLVLPVAVALLFLAWSRRLRLLWNRWTGAAVVAALLVIAPWYGWVAVDTKAEFLRGFFLKHNVGRFLGTMEGHGGGLWYYPAVLLVGTAPWSSFLALTVWFASGRRAREDVEAAHDAPGLPAPYRLLWCWIAVYLIFFSFSGTKLPNYILPVYAPLALLTARFLERWRQGAIAPHSWLVRASLACFALVGVSVGVGLLVAGGAIEVTALRGQRCPGLQPWALLGLVPVAGAALADWLLRRRRMTGALGALAGSALLFLGLFAAWGVSNIDVCKAPRPLVQALLAEQDEAEIRVASYRYFQPSLVFYCRRQVVPLQDDAQALEYLRYPIEVYLFLPAEEWQRLQGQVRLPCRLIARHRDLYRNCEVVLVTNR